jgi:hypothetical protein
VRRLAWSIAILAAILVLAPYAIAPFYRFVEAKSAVSASQPSCNLVRNIKGDCGTLCYLVAGDSSEFSGIG